MLPGSLSEIGPASKIREEGKGKRWKGRESGGREREGKRGVGKGV